MYQSNPMLSCYNNYNTQWTSLFIEIQNQFLLYALRTSPAFKATLITRFIVPNREAAPFAISQTYDAYLTRRVKLFNISNKLP